MGIAVLAVIRDDKVLAELVERHGVHPNRIADGNCQRPEGSARVSICELRVAPMTDMKAMQSELRACCT